MKKLIICSLAILMMTMGCGRMNKELKSGSWLGVICIDTLDRTKDVPFNMVCTITPEGKIQMAILNADERIIVNEIEQNGDTLLMKLPVFSSEIVSVIRHDSLVGNYYPKGREVGIAYKFYAVAGVNDRFPWYTEPANKNISGKWRIVENPCTPDSAVVIGEFKQDGNRVVGTILDPSGDYRFLEGKVSGDHFFFSKNDGAQTLILTAEIKDENTMVNGKFTGSPKWSIPWIAARDNKITLPSSEELVRVKKGYNTFEFSGLDLKGNLVSSKDEKFKNKVLAVLAGGSWCPNCLDEAKMYTELYSKYKDQGFEVVSLCFEDKTFESSKKKIERFVTQTEANYTFLYVAPRGQVARDSVLYPVEGQMAYPTSLILDRKGIIRRVETGFSGPGTGTHYKDLYDETIKLIESLLIEKLD